MRAVIKWTTVVIVAAVIAALSIVAVFKFTRSSFNVKNGKWETNLNSGSPDADMYTRALVAMFGLFALNKSETVYFHTSVDNNGNDLTSECDYVIKGKNLDCRWWSITAYGADRFLIPNIYNIYAKSKKNIKYESDGTYRIKISPEFRNGNWIPIGKKGNFRLHLRLYNPSQTIYDTISSIELPKVYREKCK